jgi:hypothetical protein
MRDKPKKLPTGLYFKRRRHGLSTTLWCWYYVPGSRQPVKESTGTADVDEAKRYRAARLAEHPQARRERKASERATVNDVLDGLEDYYRRHAKALRRSMILGLRERLGHLPMAQLTRKHLDELADEWRARGITYADRDLARTPQHPVEGATVNRAMALLRRARTLAIETRNLTLPRLTFPHFAEPVKGRYIPPGDFYAILAHVPHATKASFMELAYLTGVRKGQLRGTTLRNVRLEHGQVAALVWEAEQVKTRRQHTVPLVDRAQAIVQAQWDGLHAPGPKVAVLKRSSDTLLFQIDGRPLGDLQSEWDRACRLAGFPVGRKNGGFVFHNTRHSCLTNLAAEGVPDTVARSISGHRTASVHARYQITQESAQRAALAKMTARVQAVREA